MSAKPSQLIFSTSRVDLRQSQEMSGEVLFESPDGVPVLWIFAFGARNVWNPGDQITDRGGAVGRRNAYETQVEVAQARLEHAQDSLSESQWLWPWYSAMPILRRKLHAKPASGFIRIRAPWLFELDDKELSAWRSATSLVENAVHSISAGKLQDTARCLNQLRAFCPLVPLGDAEDQKDFANNGLYSSESEAMRLALLTLGKASNEKVFQSAVEREVVPALESLKKLPPAPRRPAMPVVADGRKGGLLSKFGKLFGRG